MMEGSLSLSLRVDQLEAAERRLLQLWRRNLRRGDLEPGTAHRLVKMTIINISSIHHSLTSSGTLTTTAEKIFCSDENKLHGM